MKKGKFDFNEVKKEYKKLKVPKSYYNPLALPLAESKWFITMSDRSRGKTTNLLLLGLVFGHLYGTEICYIRTKREMIAPKNCRSLFNVIIENGYITKLTDGKYTSIFYDAKCWYLGNVIDGKEEYDKLHPVCRMLSIDDNEIYKSSLNVPHGDFIIFDEFVEKYYYPNQFITFLDLIKTICRDRTSPMIFLASNTIDKHSPYFNEFGIYDDIQVMQMGDTRLFTTPLGTKIYFEILGRADKQTQTLRNKVNQLYYGFKNSRLASITGNDTWSMQTYPHIPDKNTYTIVENKFYIELNDNYIQLKIALTDDDYLILCEKSKKEKLHDDSIIYSLHPEDYDHRFRYGKGTTNLDKFIYKCYLNRKFRYRTNDIGTIIDNFYNRC